MPKNIGPCFVGAPGDVPRAGPVPHAANLERRERDLLAVAYKKACESRENPLKKIEAGDLQIRNMNYEELQQTEKLMQNYEAKIKDEISNIHAGVLDQLNNILIPKFLSAEDIKIISLAPGKVKEMEFKAEDILFYLTMKGKCCTYLAKSLIGNESKRDPFVKQGWEAFGWAKAIALAKLFGAHLA